MGLVPSSVVPAVLPKLAVNGTVTFPFYAIDWATFPIHNGRGEKSYRSELRALNIVKERALNMSLDIRANFGYE